MWRKETRPECCEVFEELPKNVECFLPGIKQSLDQLQILHGSKFTRNPHILDLAKPKPRTLIPQYVRSCPCRLQKPIEVIRLGERLNTRTEQLAYPKARYLLEFKEQVMHRFPPERIINLNRLIRRSLLSLYSRLANVQPPKPVIPLVKWNKQDWIEHTKALTKLSRPKKPRMQPKIHNKSMPLAKMRRFRYLSKPNIRFVPINPCWTLTEEIRTYQISERVLKLSKPILRDTSNLYQELPLKIPETVLKHKATKRTKTLAEPPAYRTAQLISAELRDNPFAISPNALKAKASKRTEELAEPREYENKHIRDDPYAIPPAALKAKARPRTIELAKPKKS